MKKIFPYFCTVISTLKLLFKVDKFMKYESFVVCFVNKCDERKVYIFENKSYTNNIVRFFIKIRQNLLKTVHSTVVNAHICLLRNIPIFLCGKEWIQMPFVLNRFIRDVL